MAQFFFQNVLYINLLGRIWYFQFPMPKCLVLDELENCMTGWGLNPVPPGHGQALNQCITMCQCTALVITVASLARLCVY